MDKPTCTIDGCAKKVHCKGLCPMHYQRRRKTGSLEKPPSWWERPRAYPACSADGCDAPGNRKGMCEKHYKRGWHEANWQRTYAKAKARRSAKRDEYLADGRAYYRANRQAILVQMRARYAGATPERRAQRRAAAKRWRELNWERRRELNMRRNARKRATQTEPVNYAAILAEHGMFCHICSLVIVDESDLHFDHVIPLALGGTHTRDNIKPAHALCNIRKGGRLAS